MEIIAKLYTVTGEGTQNEPRDVSATLEQNNSVYIAIDNSNGVIVTNDGSSLKLQGRNGIWNSVNISQPNIIKHKDIVCAKGQVPNIFYKFNLTHDNNFTDYLLVQYKNSYSDILKATYNRESLFKADEAEQDQKLIQVNSNAQREVFDHFKIDMIKDKSTQSVNLILSKLINGPEEILKRVRSDEELKVGVKYYIGFSGSSYIEFTSITNNPVEQVNLRGGRAKRSSYPKPSPERIKNSKGRSCVVYVGPRGGRYIKTGGKFVRI
jgi:hypothetical protein